MKFKQPVLFGILFWLIIFVEVSIIGFSPDLSAMGPFGFEFNQTGQVIHFIAIVLIAAILARLYYKKENPPLIEALQVALIILATGIILDVVITVPLFIKNYAVFFGDVNLWIGFVLGVLFFSVSGSYKSITGGRKK